MEKVNYYMVMEIIITGIGLKIKNTVKELWIIQMVKLIKAIEKMVNMMALEWRDINHLKFGTWGIGAKIWGMVMDFKLLMNLLSPNMSKVSSAMIEN